MAYLKKTEERCIWKVLFQFGLPFLISRGGPYKKLVASKDMRSKFRRGDGGAGPGRMRYASARDL